MVLLYMSVMMQYHMVEHVMMIRHLGLLYSHYIQLPRSVVLSSNHVSSSEERGLTRLYSIFGSEEGTSSGQYR